MYFQSDKDKKCDIKVLILLFSPKDHNYLGYIPNEQIQFVDCIWKVIQQQKEQQRVASGSGPGGPRGLRVNPNSNLKAPEAPSWDLRCFGVAVGVDPEAPWGPRDPSLMLLFAVLFAAE